MARSVPFGGGRVLVGSAVFKTVSRALVPFWVGSIPMHLRHEIRMSVTGKSEPCTRLL